MCHVSAQGVDERMINVHDKCTLLLLLLLLLLSLLLLLTNTQYDAERNHDNAKRQLTLLGVCLSSELYQKTAGTSLDLYLQQNKEECFFSVSLALCLPVSPSLSIIIILKLKDSPKPNLFTQKHKASKRLQLYKQG